MTGLVSHLTKSSAGLGYFSGFEVGGSQTVHNRVSQVVTIYFVSDWPSVWSMSMPLLFKIINKMSDNKDKSVPQSTDIN